MDFDAAVRAHVYWKVTLRWLINGERAADVMHADSPTHCELGGWILGEGLQYQDLAAYQSLVEEHRDFHRWAGEVVKAYEAGRRDQALALLAADGPFSLASARTIQAIEALKAEVAVRR